MVKAVITRAEIVSFGCLKKVVVTPDDGINLISLPNESGKTTFASFVKFVLYGFSGSRMSSVSDNEKKRFMPWDGSNAEGSVVINAGGKTYRITRTSSSSPRDRVTAVIEPSGERVFEGLVPGEEIFGVGEELFSKTAFFRQLQIPRSGDEELASQLKNISVSADEKDSADRAKKLLSDAKNELANRQKHGIYFDVKAKLEDTERRLERALSSVGELSDTELKIKKCAETVESDDAMLLRLAEEKRHIDSYEAFLGLKRLEGVENALLKAENDYNEAVKNLNFSSGSADIIKKLSEKYERYSILKAEKSLCDRELASCEMSIAEKQRTLLSDEKLKKAKSALVKSRLGLAFAALAVIASAVLALLLSASASVAAGGIMLALSAVMLALSNSTRSSIGFKNMRELKNSLAEYPRRREELENLFALREKAAARDATADSNAAEASKEIEEMIALCCLPDKSMSLSEQIENLRGAFSDAQAKHAIYLSSLEAKEKAFEGVDIRLLKESASNYDGTVPLRDRRAVENEISFCTKQKESMLARLSELKQSRAVLINGSGDVSLLKGRASELEERLSAIEKRGRALSLAIDALTEAGEHIKGAVAPKINEKAGRYFAALTDGKYAFLNAGSDLKLTADDGFTPRDCDALSAGARECAYISLRLALTDVMYPDSSVPIFLDDAFVHLDDKRLENLARLLSEIGERHQIFLITCSARLTEAIKNSDFKYSVTELKQC